MKKETKRTRWTSTNKIIRKILIDYYMSSSAQSQRQEFISYALTIGDSSLNSQYKAWVEWKLPKWTPLNLNSMTEQEFQTVLHSCFDPENPIKWQVDVSSLHKLSRMFAKPIYLKEIKDKYKLSYETINNRVKPFFHEDFIQNWKIRSKVFYLKPEVYSALSTYFALEEEFKKEWDYFRKIYKLFQE